MTVSIRRLWFYVLLAVIAAALVSATFKAFFDIAYDVTLFVAVVFLGEKINRRWHAK